MSKNAVCANIANGDRSFMRQVKKIKHQIGLQEVPCRFPQWNLSDTNCKIIYNHLKLVILYS